MTAPEGSPAARPMDGKVVAVTGASRGTGLAISRTLAGAGARVAMLARPSTHLDEAVTSIAGAIAVPVDVGQPDEVRSAFHTVSHQFGRLDALINNAAIAVPHRIEDTTDEELRLQVDTNFLGPVYCVRSALPLLRETGGTIVNISSESSEDPFPYLLMYASTKGALNIFTKALLSEVRSEGVRVTLLVSGHTRTGTWSERWEPEVRDAALAAWKEGGYTTRVAGTEPQEPEDVAETILFVLTRPPRTMLDVVWCRAAR
ncbi:MAG TPA: SDR family oxidoreductase [Acidimicrobiales bacterium]|nr:SDR family oxidoreductase [Acidimicrobiales bacterium]